MIYKDKVESLKKELEQLIVGYEKPSFQCCCGAIRHKASKAIAVVPAGNYTDWDGRQYEYQVDMPLMWTVEMDDNYSMSLTQFVTKHEIETLFEKHRPLYTKEK